MNRSAPWRWAVLAVLASLWGIQEAFVDQTIVCRAVALLLLAAGRGVLNVPGTSLAMAGVAVLFRWVNADPYYCHLAGIALLGAGFDLTATTLLRDGKHVFPRAALTGALAATLGAFLFAGSMAWVFDYRHWPDHGLEGVFRHTFTSGGLAALIGLVAVPVGLRLGRGLASAATPHPGRAFATAATACALAWMVAALVP